MSALNFDPFEGDFGDQGDRTLTDSMVRARKTHACCHCAGPICIGEVHRSRCDIADGDLMRWRWCALCCDAMVRQIDAEDDEENERYPYEARTGINKKD